MEAGVKKLREMLADRKPVVLPGVHDAISARIFEKAGFEAVYMSGYATSAAVLGMPDAGLISLTEVTTNARNIASAVNIPLVVDADDGFGNAINVRRTVRELIRAGAAAVQIEDQVAPKRCGHVAGKEVVTLEEAVGKVRAAADMRDELGTDVVLIARTDARGVSGGGLDDAVRRGQAYAAAGADVIFVEALLSEDEIARSCREIEAPVLYNYAGVSPALPLEKLEALGVSVVLVATASLRSAVRAVWDLGSAIRQEGPEAFARWNREFEQEHPLGDLHGFVGFPELRQLEERYLGEEAMRKYEGTIGYKP